MTFAGVLAGCAAPQGRVAKELAAMRDDSRADELQSRGTSAAALGDMTRAEQYFVAALRAGADAHQVVPRLIAVCVADGRYPVALDYAESHLRNHPDDVDVRYVAATLHAATGNAEEARRELRAVLALRPNVAEAHYALATLEKSRGEIMAADAEFREYLRLAPAGAHIEVARANLMRRVPR